MCRENKGIENLTECEKCGQLVETTVTVRDFNGNEMQWCEDCAEFYGYQCDHCGEWFEEHPNIVEMDDGSTEHWCDRCVEDASCCDHCGSYCESTEAVIVRGSAWRGYDYEQWCEHCRDNHTVTCEDCDNVFSEDSDLARRHYVWGVGEIDLCESCIDDHYTTCYECGDLVHYDDARYDSWDDPYCPDCIGNHRESENVHCYGHTSGDVFWLKADLAKSWYELKGDEHQKLFLGIELETDGNDNRGSLADDIASEYDDEHIVCKEDGSLGEDGLEIVSLPMTPEVHLTSGMWERIAELVRYHDGTSHDAGTCGLHIHMSRNYFADHDAVYRLDRLFHRFEQQMVRFSRRRYDDLHWCRIGEDDLHEIPDVHERKKKWEDKKACAGRYEAVNDTNTATVEIRLWRGTLNMETFRATVEMTTGLAIIANTMTDEFADELTWSMVKVLVKFALEEHGLPHDDLDAYLVRRGL